MKKRYKTALCLALSMLFLVNMAVTASAAAEATFTDVGPDHWAYSYIQNCAGAGLIKGVGDGIYMPEATLSGEQFVTMIGRSCFGNKVRPTALDTWSSAYIRAAEELGVLKGVEISDMASPVRRCDMAMILYNLFTKVRGIAADNASFGELFPTGYDPWKYSEAIGFCYAIGLLNGYSDGYFHGDDVMTRAQAAKVLFTAAGLTDIAPPVQTGGSTRLYVLMYHSIIADDDPCGEWKTTESTFRSDLQWLTDNGYTTVLPSELVAGAPLPNRAVLITFDDGYANNYTRAFPILREFNAKAVVSPIVKLVETEAPGYLTWDMCREMAESGLIEFGSHTYDCHGTNEDVRYGIMRIPGESQEDYENALLSDLQTSVDLLEKNLNRRVNFFAYPSGKLEPWADKILRQLFDVTVTSQSAVADISRSLYQLPRCNMDCTHTVATYLSSASYA